MITHGRTSFQECCTSTPQRAAVSLRWKANDWAVVPPKFVHKQFHAVCFYLVDNGRDDPFLAAVKVTNERTMPWSLCNSLSGSRMMWAMETQSIFSLAWNPFLYLSLLDQSFLFVKNNPTMPKQK